MESQFFMDDAEVIAKMLNDEWSLGPENQPNIEYIPERYFQDDRVGGILVQVISTSYQNATTDYRTMEKTSRLTIKLDTRFRDTQFLWGQEIYRILLANRRIGRRHNLGNSELIPTGHRTLPNETGWYTTIFDVTFIAHHVTIHSAGFGDKINKQIDDKRDDTQ